MYVTGWTEESSLFGDTSAGDFGAYVGAYDTSGTRQWGHRYESSKRDLREGIAVATSGSSLYMVGETDGNFLNASQNGNGDGFLSGIPTP